MSQNFTCKGRQELLSELRSLVCDLGNHISSSPDWYHDKDLSNGDDDNDDDVVDDDDDDDKEPPPPVQGRLLPLPCSPNDSPVLILLLSINIIIMGEDDDNAEYYNHAEDDHHGEDDDNAEDGGEDDYFGFGCGFSACKWFHSSSLQ